MTKAGLYTVWDILHRGGQDPSRPAIECPGSRPLTYQELRQLVSSVVGTLNARGFHRNDRIALITPAGPETAAALLAVMAGFTAVPLNPQIREQEFSDIFSLLRIRAIIVEKGYPTAAGAAARLLDIPVLEIVPEPGTAGKFHFADTGGDEAAPPEFAREEDIATVILTSGTSSTPKKVPLNQRQFCLSAYLMIRIHGYTDTVRNLIIVPYFHITGIKGVITPSLLAGGTVICPRDFIPADFLPILREFRPTGYIAVPALQQGIVRELKKVPPALLKNNSLKRTRSGSAALPPAVRKELEDLLGAPVSENYGTTETGTISNSPIPGNGSVGIPVIDALAIIDEEGNELGPGETGEIIVKGETVFSGYEDAPEENAAAFINGWFRTGDTGYRDREGYLFLTGRKKEQINKGGLKISPLEIDTVLAAHPGIREAMTFGIADPVLGEEIAAMIVLSDPGVTEGNIRGFLLDRLVPAKIPKKLFFVPAIPKNSQGKPLRRIASRQYGQP